MKRKAQFEDIFEERTAKRDDGLEEGEQDEAVASDQEMGSEKDLSELKEDEEKSFPGGHSSFADEGEILLKD